MAINNDYLYLFYGNYLEKESINPYAVINNAKEEVKRVGLNRLVKTRTALRKQKTGFEEGLLDLYGLTPEEFGIKIAEAPIMTSLNDFDQAQNLLERSLGETTDTLVASTAIARIINDLDIILTEGAKLGGLTAGSIQQAKSYYHQIEKLQTAIQNGTAGNKSDKKSIANAGTQAISSLSGSLLEIASAIGWLWVTKQVLDKSESVMLSVGKTAAGNVLTRILPDPQMEAARQRIEQSIASVPEGKGDNFVITKNKIKGTVETASFQAKNFRDIRRISVTSEKTYGQLNVGSYFTWKFLVNTAGGLADTHVQENVGFSRFRAKENLMRAWQIDDIWSNIKRQIQVLCAADVIAARGAAGLGAAGLDYYIVRDKSGFFKDVPSNKAGIKIISIADIFTKMIEEYRKEGDLHAMGVKNALIEAHGSDITKGARMKNYGEKNSAAFVSPPYYPDWESAKTRSSSAYESIYQAVYNTKVSISLNLISLF